MFFSVSTGTISRKKISSPIPSSSSIDQHNIGLEGIRGAEIVVKLLRVQCSIQRIILGHNSLGDTGTVAIFDYLRSEEGKRHRITEISLNSNGIGDKGLWAIARYLEDNDSLNTLFLQNNNFEGERPIMLRFVLAVNRSRLHTLNLTSNPALSDSLCSTFLTTLCASRLSDLQLSLCALGPSSVPALISFLTSPKAVNLKQLKLNGNSFGLDGLTKIIDALEQSNWSLNHLEIYACCTNEPHSEEGWKALERRFSTRILERNRFLTSRAASDALVLLRHARPALLHYGRITDGARSRLPMELVIHTLSFLDPALSTFQHLRVCKYA
ncbi:hypothetical protein M422DRAFT_34347, partial [Sphaerobolus stellatus SS14]